MIHEYDFSSVFNEAVSEEQARQIKWQSEYKPSVNELLKKLSEALQDQDQIEHMWPDARLKDKEMFTHLNIEFDLDGEKITAETAAKDYHGVPIYQYVYDTADKSAIEITNIEDQGIKEAKIDEVPQPISSETAQISSEQTDDILGGTKTNRDVLTLEEQRALAIKVVSFFIMLIIASFVILYIYHRCTQKHARSTRDKKTL